MRRIAPTFGSALAARRAAGTGAVVAYLLTDARRHGRYRATAIRARDAGVAAIELGFPFSDPIADGRVLRDASERALHHGTDWSDLLSSVREVSPILPCGVMSYANPLFRRGVAASIREIRRAGATALIVPDLSLEDSAEWRRASRRERVDLVAFAAPETPEDRVDRLAESAHGFLYVVSHFGTTGTGGLSSVSAVGAVIRRAHRTRPELPVLVGFGIRGPADARRWRRLGADGVVVGSALEQLGSAGAPESVGRFLETLVRATR